LASTLDSYIEIKAGVRSGKPTIAGRRIAVQDVVVWYDRLGLSSDAIATEYDLSLAEIHAALAYYFDNREEIDKDLAEAGAVAETLRSQTRSPLQTKLDAFSNNLLR
jgi:uncharacterized protein (DUF433 family)